MNLDFTHRKYRLLCNTILDSGYIIVSVKKFLESDSINDNKRLCVLRHDVDRNINNALKIAYIEKEYNISSTYYFRKIKSKKQIEIIKQIADMNHEIGYHYENLSDTNGDVDKALNDFNHNLKRIRNICPVKTAAMHGAPLSKYDNRDLWNYSRLTDFNLVGDAYISVDFNKILYFNDTGRTWIDNKFNIRDRTYTNDLLKKNELNIKSTDDLIRFIINYNQNIYISTHPERWADGTFEYFTRYFFDTGINIIKVLYNKLFAIN